MGTKDEAAGVAAYVKGTPAVDEVNCTQDKCVCVCAFMFTALDYLPGRQWDTSGISEKSDGLDAPEPSFCPALSEGGVKINCTQLAWLCSVQRGHRLSKNSVVRL